MVLRSVEQCLGSASEASGAVLSRLRSSATLEMLLLTTNPRCALQPSA